MDFYSASTYHYTLGIETRLFTPIFAMSRVVGWAAHVPSSTATTAYLAVPSADARPDGTSRSGSAGAGGA